MPNSFERRMWETSFAERMSAFEGTQPGLADPEAGARGHRREAHHNVDEEEGKGGHEPQREEIEGSLALHALVDGLQRVAELRPHPVAQQVSRGEEGSRGAEGRSE